MIHPTAKIDETARIYGDRSRLRVGPNSRIDAFCVISIGEQGIEIGRNVHIGCGVYLFGGGGKIVLEDCTFLSPRATLYTATDDQAAVSLVGPQVKPELRMVIAGDIIIRRGAGVGTGGIVFPGVTLGEGAVVGALSIAKRDVEPGHVVVGPNQRTVKYRHPDQLRRLLKEMGCE